MANTDRKKMLIYIQSALCVLWAVLMAAAAVRIYAQGAAYQSQGHPEVWIYTREKAVAAVLRYLPLLLLAIVTNIIAIFTGARDENRDRAVYDPDLINIYRKDRETLRDTAKEVSNARRLRIVRLAVFMIAAVFVVAGILNGSMKDVLIKAIIICTECIGLG